MKKPHIRVHSFIAADRFNKQFVDLSGAMPVVVSSYSYPTPARTGQVADLPNYPMEQRARCYVRNHRSASTVNGVCLDCIRARGKVVRPR
jgi:hypothetical protein